MASYAVGLVLDAVLAVGAEVVVEHCAVVVAGAVVRLLFQLFDDPHRKMANMVNLGRKHHWMQYSSRYSLTLQRHCKEKNIH